MLVLKFLKRTINHTDDAPDKKYDDKGYFIGGDVDEYRIRYKRYYNDNPVYYLK